MLAPPPFALGEPLNEGSDADSLLSIRKDLRIAALGDAPHAVPSCQGLPRRRHSAPRLLLNFLPRRTAESYRCRLILLSVRRSRLILLSVRRLEQQART